MNDSTMYSHCYSNGLLVKLYAGSTGVCLYVACISRRGKAKLIPTQLDILGTTKSSIKGKQTACCEKLKRVSMRNELENLVMVCKFFPVCIDRKIRNQFLTKAGLHDATCPMRLQSWRMKTTAHAIISVYQLHANLKM